MNRRLFLIRHAKSAWDDPRLDDFARPLNKRGEREAADLRKLFANAGYAPELVLCSSAQRTRETFAAVLPALTRETRIVSTRALYIAPVERLLDTLRRIEPNVESLAMVGHNPGLEDFARLLCGAGEPAAMKALAVKYPPAGVAVIDFEGADWTDAGSGAGHLAAFHTPED